MQTMTYGEWLRSQRRRRGLSQERLGELAGKHRTHINRIENGGIDLPADDTRAIFHAVLGTSEDDLVAAGILKPVGINHSGPREYVAATSVHEANQPSLPEFQTGSQETIRNVQERSQELRDSWGRPDEGWDAGGNPDLQRVLDLLHIVRMNASRSSALVTILEAFLEIDSVRRFRLDRE